MNNKRLSVAGLILITFLAAIQYVFLRNIPESVSVFSFLFLTNAIGFIVIACTHTKKIMNISSSAVKNGLLFAVLLTGANYFLTLGIRGTESVIGSSIFSMYFIFITPMLLITRQRVNLLSGIASTIAVIGLFLIVGVDSEQMISDQQLLYLFIAEILFSAYVLLVAAKAKKEDAVHLSMAQMFFSALIGLSAWGIEARLGFGRYSLPMSMKFWISVIFVGVFIRGIYGLVQISCQKYVSPITTSLIFASGVIINLGMEPILCKIVGNPYSPITFNQIVGCVIFVIAALFIDDSVVEIIGYVEQDYISIDENGNSLIRSTLARKMIVNTLKITMLTVISCMIVSLTVIQLIRNSAVQNAEKLGKNAAYTSAEALRDSLEQNLSQLVSDRATLAEEKLTRFSNGVSGVADYAEILVQEERIDHQMLSDYMETMCLSVFETIDHVAAIYMGTESGLFFLCDAYEGIVKMEEDVYDDFRDSTWYRRGKDTETCGFSDQYKDDYGLSSLITCVAPFFDKKGNFTGCVAMDVLTDDLFNTLVKEGIIAPKAATLIDHNGNIIAGKETDLDDSVRYNIFDNNYNSKLKVVGEELLKNEKGLIVSNQKISPYYYAYATVPSTDWTIVVYSPVSDVTKPVRLIETSIDKSTGSMIDSVSEHVFGMVQKMLVLAAAILLIVTFFVGLFSKRIIVPLKTLENDVLRISKGDFTQHTEVQTDDEIGRLANAFNLMTDSIRQYMIDLKDATVRQERIASELSVATEIQKQMLPSAFHTFSDRQDFELFAAMTPAKEVGGDFYDFFMVDDYEIIGLSQEAA